MSHQQHSRKVIYLADDNQEECLEQIRNGAAVFSRLKVIMLSTSSYKYSIERSYELVADFYAVKPGTLQRLKNLLQDIFTLN